MRISLFLICVFIVSYPLAFSDAQTITSPYELTEIFRIGDESKGDSIFFQDHEDLRLAVNSTNHLFVGGYGESPVYSFSGNGEFIGFVGSEGVGPGEFNNSSNIVIGPGDSIYVYDSPTDRISVFEPQTRRYSHGLRVTVDEGEDVYRSSAQILLGVVKDGYLFQYNTAYFPPGEPGGYDPDESRLVFVNLVNRQGRLAKKSLAELPAGERLIKTSQSRSGSTISIMPLPFGRSPFFIFDNNQLYAAWNDVIDIAIMSKHGDHLRSIRVGHEALSVTRKELADIVAHSSKSIRKWVLESESIPKTKPAFDALIVDDQGLIWIRKYPDTGDELATWLIVNPTGQLEGKLDLPVGLLLKVIKKDRVYASFYDETSGPYIVAYKIVR
ncbi:MAG: 6-bladed beta-propeller [Bacteroidetes bacterium]|nr:6-bladed beta-propeller [Bacteroidota bacterium]